MKEGEEKRGDGEAIVRTEAWVLIIRPHTRRGTRVRRTFPRFRARKWGTKAKRKKQTNAEDRAKAERGERKKNKAERNREREKERPRAIGVS